jgi:uncharacterized protein (DUF362 family)
MQGMEATVAIARARELTDEAIDQAVARAVEAACDIETLIPAGATVLLKPNVFMPAPAPTTTDPRVIGALARLARAAGASRVIVAEGRSISTAHYRKVHRTTRECFEVTGIAEAARQAGAELVALEEGEYVEVALPEAQVLKRAHVARPILDADVFINVPVLKIHSLALITVAIKNLHGIISDDDKLFAHNYRDLPPKLADLLRIRRPDLNIVDALHGQGADHAEEGLSIEVGAILAGRDAVAVDAVAAAVMGLGPLEPETTRAAHEAGLGQGDLDRITVVGESLESVRQSFPRPDLEISTRRFPGLTVYAGDYCRSCQYYVRRGLDKLSESGQLSAERPLSLVIGRDPVVPDSVAGKVIMVGDCALGSESVKRLRNRLLLERRLHVVYACPPQEFRIRAAELLGD